MCLGCAVILSNPGSDGGGLSDEYHAEVSYGVPARTSMWVSLTCTLPGKRAPSALSIATHGHPVILRSGAKPHKLHRRGIVPWTVRGKMMTMIMSLSFFWVRTNAGRSVTI